MGTLITMGQLKVLFERQRIVAASLLIWVMAGQIVEELDLGGGLEAPQRLADGDRRCWPPRAACCSSGLDRTPAAPVGGAEHAALALDVAQDDLASIGHVLAEDGCVVRGHFVQRPLDGLAERHGIAWSYVAGGSGRSGSR